MQFPHHSATGPNRFQHLRTEAGWINNTLLAQSTRHIKVSQPKYLEPWREVARPIIAATHHATSTGIAPEANRLHDLAQQFRALTAPGQIHFPDTHNSELESQFYTIDLIDGLLVLLNGLTGDAESRELIAPDLLVAGAELLLWHEKITKRYNDWRVQQPVDYRWSLRDRRTDDFAVRRNLLDVIANNIITCGPGDFTVHCGRLAVQATHDSLRHSDSVRMSLAIANNVSDALVWAAAYSIRDLHPQGTYDALRAMYVPDDGEKHPRFLQTIIDPDSILESWERALLNHRNDGYSMTEFGDIFAATALLAVPWRKALLTWEEPDLSHEDIVKITRLEATIICALFAPQYTPSLFHKDRRVLQHDTTASHTTGGANSLRASSKRTVQYNLFKHLVGESESAHESQAKQLAVPSTSTPRSRRRSSTTLLALSKIKL